MTQTETSSELDQIGAVVSQRYRLDELIGTGPVHRTYKATDLEGEDVVCLKIPRLKFRENDGFAARYRRDLLEAMKVKDRSCVVPSVLIEHQGVPIQVLPLMTGLPLHHWFEAVGRKEERLLHVLTRTIKALGRLHTVANRMHGSIKPSNLFVSEQDEPLLLDLAATGRLEDHFAEKAQTGQPVYCSPEQLSGERADAGSDLYLLGLVLYQTLTRRHPYFGSPKTVDGNSERLLTSLLHQLQQTPAPASIFLDDIPLWADRFLARCLHPNPQERFADHHEALHWLQNHTKSEQDVSAEQRPLPPAGREPEMRLLQSHLDRLLGSREDGCMIRLHGPLGVGKTRCQDWLLDQALGKGMKVLVVEPTPESGLHLQSVLAELSREWPEISHGSHPVVESLLTSSIDNPTLLVVRDIHQADDTLVAFLRELAGVVTDVPLMVLLIDEETEYQSELMSALIEEIEEHIALGPLDKRAIANLIEEKCWTVPSASLTSWVYKVSEGNALHATLLVGYLRDNGFLSEGVEFGWSTSPPTDRPTLEQALIWKLASLSILARTILETAAVLGNPFRLATLNAISYRNADELDEALGEGVSKGILELSDSGRVASYRWRHSKFRQTLLQGIHHRRRQRIHRLAAAFYSQDYDDPARVAYHFLKAGDTPEVFYWGALAAQQAYLHDRRGECSFWLNNLLSRVPKEEWLGPDAEKAREAVARDQVDSLDLEAWVDWFHALSGHPPSPSEKNELVIEAQRALHSSLPWEKWRAFVEPLSEQLSLKENKDKNAGQAMILLELEWRTRAPNREPFPVSSN